MDCKYCNYGKVRVKIIHAVGYTETQTDTETPKVPIPSVCRNIFYLST